MGKLEITKNLAQIKKELNQAELIAVTKYSPVEDIISAYEAHQYDFGENKVGDLIEKAKIFEEKKLTKVRWHMIGHLQSNKVKDLLKIPKLYAIHSVDSLSLLEELLKKEDLIKGPNLKLFFQVNTSHENEKTGFSSLEELKAAIELLLKREKTKYQFFGLMTMGTIRTTDFEVEAERCFRELKKLASNLETIYAPKINSLKLSMGMSQDYKIAILEGSNFVRIGSLIFK